MLNILYVTDCKSDLLICIILSVFVTVVCVVPDSSVLCSNN